MCIRDSYEPGLEEGGAGEKERDEQWTRCFRDNVLEIAWDQLEDYQSKNKGSITHRVLRLRAENPSFDSKQLAAEVSNQSGREVNAATFRQQLRRARVRFAEYVVEEIANGLDAPEPERIHDELIALGLYEFIKDVLPEGWGKA